MPEIETNWSEILPLAASIKLEAVVKSPLIVFNSGSISSVLYAWTSERILALAASTHWAA